MVILTHTLSHTRRQSIFGWTIHSPDLFKPCCVFFLSVSGSRHVHRHLVRGSGIARSLDEIINIKLDLFHVPPLLAYIVYYALASHAKKLSAACERSFVQHVWRNLRIVPLDRVVVTVGAPLFALDIEVPLRFASAVSIDSIPLVVRLLRLQGARTGFVRRWIGQTLAKVYYVALSVATEQVIAAFFRCFVEHERFDVRTARPAARNLPRIGAAFARQMV